MHAPSDRGPQIQVGKRSAAALAVAAVLAFASCGSSSSDNPGLSGPQQTPTTIGPVAAGGPALSVVHVAGLPVPQLAGESAVNAQLSAIGSKLSGTCTVSAKRDDKRIASFLWSCGGQLTPATFDLANGRKLSLGDLLQGGYGAYLGSTAAAQIRANGGANPVTSDLSVWYLTPESLVVVFPAGTVSFPITSLSGYIRSGGPLGS